MSGSDPETPAGVEVHHDISYLGPDRLEKMDAYLPSRAYATPHPAVLLIHGGGWRLGDKANVRERNIGHTLAERGFAVFSINYLLNEGSRDASGKIQTTKVAWPQNLFDCKSALRFLRHQAREFRVDPKRIAVMGGSAGGHFAMLLGATANLDALNIGGLYTEQSNEVSAVINFYGVPDLQERHLHVVTGATEEETRENARLASPVTWFHPEMPPMLIAHGTADAMIPVRVSRKLTQILETIGARYWYVEISGAPHTFHLEPEEMDLRPVVLSFLERHLGVRTGTESKVAIQSDRK